MKIELAVVIVLTLLLGSLVYLGLTSFPDLFDRGRELTIEEMMEWSPDTNP